jgi:GT2 family glycosyltransferase
MTIKNVVMKNYPSVHVVVLSFNQLKDTLSALDSLCRMTYPNFELVLVDNHSTDSTVAEVRDHFPQVVILNQPDNLGFACGMNAGLRRALDLNVDFALVINNDVEVAPSMLTLLVESMAPSIGAAAPLIYYASEPNRVWSAGFSRDPVLLEMRGGARGQLDQGQWHVPFPVDYLLGCAVLLNVQALRQVGLFDQRFFFYYEDLDLSIKLNKGRYQLLTVPQAKMWHKVARSAPVGSPFRTYQLARSSAIFFRTHCRGWRLVPVLFFRLGSAIQISLRFLWHRQFSLLKNYWLGLWNGLRSV